MQARVRTFVGTSQRRDYAISEKLGGGRLFVPPSRPRLDLSHLLMHNEKEGVPVVALREIKILKIRSRPSAVAACDIVVEAGTSTRSVPELYLS